MDIGPGASGFATPLPAGTCSFWVQDTATGVAAYNFDVRVSAVPELPSAALLLAGVAGLAPRRALCCGGGRAVGSGVGSDVGFDVGSGVTDGAGPTASGR